ncbi:MAG: ion transporter [Candidatus Eisenbacteria bacterium]|nr:ion transporter [Candidatus Eisenbacteria bacterium]
MASDRPEPPDHEVLRQSRQQRWELLAQLKELLDRPMIVLSLVWVVLLILDLTRGLGPTLATLNYVIWGLFVLQFLVEFVIAPEKGRYLRSSWLTAVSLAIPALRVVRVFGALRFLRAGRAVRSLRLLRVLTSLNRGMLAVRDSLARRGVGYVAILTAVVALAGAAGMQQFESPQALRNAGIPVESPDEGLRSYLDALWWTAMILTTMGSAYWPETPEGRILGFLLSLYALAVLGYVTGALASFFIGMDANAAAQQARAKEPGPGEPPDRELLDLSLIHI